VVAVTVAVVDVAVAVTVADDPAGTFERIASAVPAVPVCAGDVMNPTVVEKLTVTPLTTSPATSRTVATIDATGAGPPPTVAARVTVAGMPVADGVVEGFVIDASSVQLTLKMATSRHSQRMKPI
jgi:hypothetical protein